MPWPATASRRWPPAARDTSPSRSTLGPSAARSASSLAPEQSRESELTLCLVGDRAPTRWPDQLTIGWQALGHWGSQVFYSLEETGQSRRRVVSDIGHSIFDNRRGRQRTVVKAIAPSAGGAMFRHKGNCIARLRKRSAHLVRRLLPDDIRRLPDVLGEPTKARGGKWRVHS